MRPCLTEQQARRRQIVALWSRPPEEQLANSEVYVAAREEHYAEVSAKPHYEDLVGPLHQITIEQIERALRRLMGDQLDYCTAAPTRRPLPWDRGTPQASLRAGWRPCTEAL